MKVVHINLNSPFNGETEFYFGSLKAIYDSIPQDKIGIAYKSLTNALGASRNTRTSIARLRSGY